MTRKERVKLAVQHKETDVVPYHVRFMYIDPIAERLGDPNIEDSFGNHFSFFRPRFAYKDENDGFNKEMGAPFDGVRTGQGTYINEDNIDEYKLADPKEDKYWENYDEILERDKDRFQFFDISGSMYERAFSLRGMQQILEDMMLEKDFANKLYDRILEMDLAFLEAGLKKPVDAVRFGDDWGTQHSMIMPPYIWREFIKPRMKVMFEYCRKAGKITMLHSCGNIVEIMPELIEIGLDIYETMQPEAMDVFKVKEEFGKDLSFWGGVSMQQVLAYGTPQDVTDEINLKCEKLGKGGGYICGPSHAVTVDVPIENNIAMINAMRYQKHA